MGSTTNEPVLKEICKRIAADELRHYKLFYNYLKQYLEKEQISRPRRLWIALLRLKESEDDELAYAYYAANGNGEPYSRKQWSEAYMRRAYGYYRLSHVQRMVAMTFKAAGLRPQSRIADWTSHLAYNYLKTRHKRLLAAGA